MHKNQIGLDPPGIVVYPSAFGWIHIAMESKLPATNVTLFPGLKRSKRRVSEFYGTDWGVLPQEGFLELTKHREFTGETWRVLGTAMGMMDMGNKLRIRTVDIAEHLDIKPTAVARQLKKLVSAGVLKPRKLYGWELQPRYAFKGDPDKHLRRAPGGELVIV